MAMRQRLGERLRHHLRRPPHRRPPMRPDRVLAGSACVL